MIKNNFKDKTILITGASGSIGSALVKKFLKTKCKVVRALSNDENGMFYLSRQIEEANILNFNKTMYKKRIRYLIGDVRDYKRNLQACNGVDIIIHAAAMKHVDICEYNKDEANKTNIHGTKALIKAAAENKVKKFLFISYSLLFILFLVGGIYMEFNYFYYLLLIFPLTHLFFFQMRIFNFKDPSSCLKAFKSNNVFGLIILLNILIVKNL